MRTKEEILKEAKTRIDDLAYFDSMIGLPDTRRRDLMLMQELVALVQQPQWIPCSERLPECKSEVLVYTCWDNYYLAFRRACGNKEFVADNFDFEDGEVLAWMPLPEPYKAD